MNYRNWQAQHSKTALIRLPGRKNIFCAYNLARYGLSARRQQSQEGKQQRLTGTGKGGQQISTFVIAAAHV
jgi:hypothetical protein